MAHAERPMRRLDAPGGGHVQAVFYAPGRFGLSNVQRHVAPPPSEATRGAEARAQFLLNSPPGARAWGRRVGWALMTPGRGGGPSWWSCCAGERQGGRDPAPVRSLRDGRGQGASSTVAPYGRWGPRPVEGPVAGTANAASSRSLARSGSGLCRALCRALARGRRVRRAPTRSTGSPLRSGAARRRASQPPVLRWPGPGAWGVFGRPVGRPGRRWPHAGRGTSWRPRGPGWRPAPRRSAPQRDMPRPGRRPVSPRSARTRQPHRRRVVAGTEGCRQCRSAPMSLVCGWSSEG